jgi:predicted nucleotidyltransferase
MEKVFHSLLIQDALRALAVQLQKSRKSVHLLIGGETALVAAYKYKSLTEDVDGILLQSMIDEVADEVAAVTAALKLPLNWLNPFYQTYAIYLPEDYLTRVRRFLDVPSLAADALGPEDLTIMKLMAGRTKDHSHILFLKRNFELDLELIEKRLGELVKIYPDVAKKALDLFDDLFGDVE